jgi:hypothetical protein
MAAVDCSKTPRSKSIKARALTLRDYEARKLAQDGQVLIVREVKAPARGIDSGRPLRAIEPSDDSGLWLAKYGYGDDRSFLVRCPFGPVDSPLWGREAWAMLIRRGSSIHSERVPHYRADGPGISRWRSSTSMPTWASRFPNLRHESCEVVQGRRLMLDHPELGKVACEEDDSDTLARIWRHDLWAWCSLVVDLDRLEVADA